ncbi:AarF/UbiB family protein [Vampirovibrio sp.]|uniref:AarF/UbiB family protein n=1 Tax=Vampirovibrio sp. TaxID=2717857 RepID=UPI0035930C43
MSSPLGARPHFNLATPVGLDSHQPVPPPYDPEILWPLPDSLPDAFSPPDQGGDGTASSKAPFSAPWLNGPLGQVLDACFDLKKLSREATQALLRPPESIGGENPIQSGLKHWLNNPQSVETLASDDEFTGLATLLAAQKAPLALKTAQSQAFSQGTPVEKAALMLSHAGVGPGKLFQILADDPRVPQAQRAIFRQLQSKGAVTRTLAETQALINQLYQPGTYQLIKPLGVGTIGEVYLAQQGDQPVVIKVLKQGVDADSMAQEKKLAKTLLKSVFPNPKKQAYHLKRADNLYKQWEQELDFAQEAQNAKGIAKGATRYQVAQSKACGYASGTGKAISLVQEMAPGIELKKLTELLALHDAQPAKYREQVAPYLNQSPWLEDPNPWKRKLPNAFLKAYNQQALLRIKPNETFLTHGDPHPGNIFINVNPNRHEVETTFIDAGLAIPQTSKKVAAQLGLLLGSISGNSKKLSQYILSNADLPADVSPTQLGAQLRQALDEKLFKANVNLTDCQHNQQFMEALLEKHCLVLPESETTTFKAQLQAIRTYDEISKAVGQPQNSYLRDSLPDLYQGIKKLLWAQPVAASRELLPAGLHYCREGNNAVRNTLQFLVPKPTPQPESVHIEEID